MSGIRQDRVCCSLWKTTMESFDEEVWSLAGEMTVRFAGYTEAEMLMVIGRATRIEHRSWSSWCLPDSELSSPGRFSSKPERSFARSPCPGSITRVVLELIR